MAGGSDHLLLDALTRRLRQPAGWLVVVLHLSRLPPPAPRPHHRRIARVLMDDTAGRHEGTVFALSNGDLALVCRSGSDRPPPPLPARVASPRALADVLARLLRADMVDGAAVIDVWPLDIAGDAALAHAVARVSASAAPTPPGPAFPAREARGDARWDGRSAAATPDALAAALDAALEGPDAAELVRRRTTILIATHGVRALFREIGFSRAALDARGARGASADADPYLFRHLAERLDGRLLALVQQAIGHGGPLDPTRPGVPGLHLGLTLAGLRSDGFARLQQALLASGVGLGVEIALIEACADPEAFEQAHAALRRAGVTVVLEGLSRPTLGLTRVAALQPDLVKLAWSPRMAEHERSLEAEEALIRDLGAERVVLHGAEDEAALRWGLERGIRRFQGRHTDAILGALRFSACEAAAACTLPHCIGRELAASAAGRRGCHNLALLDAGAPPPPAAARRPPAPPARLRPRPRPRAGVHPSRPGGGARRPPRAQRMIATLRRRLREDAGETTAHDDSRELVRLIGDCATASISRSVLVLRLSLLPRERTQPHHLRLAAAALDPLRSADRARRFDLRNHDLVWIWRGEAAEAVETCRLAVDHLFADDADNPGPNARPEGLLKRFELPEDSRALLGIVEASLASGAAASGLPEPNNPPLDLARLDALEAALQRADLARFARRRPVCVIGPGSPSLRLDWEKRFLSIEELSAALLPEHSAQADPWLFRRLTRTLDRRMLALLSDPAELRDAGRFSLNLNVASIVSPEFVRFDEALPARLRGEVLLEMQPADVIADAAAFLFAREFTRMRGYRLVLRGLTPMLLRLFPKQALAVDWLELRWSPDLPGLADPLGDADAGAVLLGRADTPAALAWARTRGISRVRGRAAHLGENRIA